jgi:hypothetical protein
MGRKTTDAEIQKVYDEFWRHIVEPNGVLDNEQVKKELYDFHNVIQEVTKVYLHVTNNQFSKPLTSAEAVIDATEAHYKWWYSEGGEDEEWGTRDEASIECPHANVVSARNKVILSGLMCKDCGALFPEGDAPGILWKGCP